MLGPMKEPGPTVVGRRILLTPMTLSMTRACLLVILLLGGMVLPSVGGPCCCADDAPADMTACDDGGSCCSSHGDDGDADPGAPAEDDEPDSDDCTCPRPCCSVAGSMTAMRSATVTLIVQPMVHVVAGDDLALIARDAQFDLLRPPQS